MRRTALKGIRKTTLFITAAILLLVSMSARADLCLLQQGQYTLTGTPCSTADTTDGTTDKVINMKVYTGTAYTFDVVFDQNGYISKAAISGFQNKIKYDATILADSATCEGTACTKPACTVDPDSKFSLNPCTLFSLNCCQKIFTSTDGLGAGVYVWNQDAELGTPITDNIVTARIEFKAIPTSASVGTIYDLVFDTGDASNGTYVQTSDLCNVFGAVCTDSGGTNFPQQATMTTRLTVDEIPCFTGKPGAATLTCKGTPPACSTSAGDVVATLQYTLPSTCWKDDAASSLCSNYGITFTDTALGGTITRHASDANPYTYTITNGVGQNLSAVVIDGISDGCNSSSSYSSSNGGTATTNAASCTCGEVPKITLNPESFLTGTFIQSGPISVPFIVTLDSSLSLPSDIPSGGLTLYYTNNSAASSYQTLDIRSTLQSSGVFTATIPGDYVVADTPIYFCVIARDSNTAEGKYPETCDITSVSTLVSTAAVVPGENIIAGTRFWFIPGQEPYPNQFPFQPTEDVPLRIFFTLNDTPVNVTAQIYSLDGTLIRHLDYDATNSFTACTPSNSSKCNMCTQAGSDNYQKGCIWDGTTYEGGNHFVANGMYIINIHAVSNGSAFRGSSFDYTKGLVVMK